jgi:hypothetical protein
MAVFSETGHSSGVQRMTGLRPDPPVDAFDANGPKPTFMQLAAEVRFETNPGTRRSSSKVGEGVKPAFTSLFG